MTEVELKIEEKRIKIDSILDKIKKHFAESGIWFDYEYDYVPKCELCEDLEGEELENCMNSVDLMYTLYYKPTATWFKDEDYSYAACLTALRGVVMTAELMLGMDEDNLLVDYDEFAFDTEEDNSGIHNVVFFCFGEHKEEPPKEGCVVSMEVNGVRYDRLHFAKLDDYKKYINEPNTLNEKVFEKVKGVIDGLDESLAFVVEEFVDSFTESGFEPNEYIHFNEFNVLKCDVTDNAIVIECYFNLNELCDNEIDYTDTEKDYNSRRSEVE